MISALIDDVSAHMDKSIVALAHEFAAVRTGRASSVVLSKVTVEYYGTPTPLAQMATVTTPEPQLLVVQPYDKSSIGAIEKAIRASDLGLNPMNDGSVVRVPFPPLNEERRRELVKLCKTYAEEARVACRNIRRDANEKLKRAEKAGEITQDDLRRAEADVQKTTDAHIAKIDEALKRKELEIMEV